MEAKMAKTGALANHLMDLRSKGKLTKPSLVVSASMRTPFPGEKGPDNYEIMRAHQLEDEISAIKDQLGNWDHEVAGKQAQKSLQAELKSRQADLMSSRARLNLEDDDKLPKLPKKKKDAGLNGMGPVGY
jgi:hypothetical protein